MKAQTKHTISMTAVFTLFLLSEFIVNTVSNYILTF